MSADQKPLLRVVKGDPDDYQLAALTAVIAGLAAAAPSSEDKPAARSEWANPARRMRRPLQHGPGAWRASGFPG
ncbi:acyl-CoA carboxylase subunit epsilon [Lentzea flava]|uniref:Acetyl-CoA carboxylase biotin carboxyl carrier protein subunit n=1 Tax=Lentzea flava TaxID=103732 RepID=A0ABQ2V4S8_9PSEU|nr:acyl-CoA carboxylase subunit epsilon [Lentzea flava]MCP2203081.1 Acyl-CoA carboxylase epsilon subunit [Lentzea flava]GGU64872.1 acetyl-CoA carboxylase biotin carboxyl carrier protein subunit [Lentzea flava]